MTSVTVSPGFFATAGVQIRRGRGFSETDGLAGAENIVINAALASQFFPGEDPIGRRLRFVSREAPPAGQPAPIWWTVVGVSPSIRHSNPQDPASGSVVYLPHRQDPPGGASLMVRSHLEPGAVMSEVRRAVQAIDQDQPVFTMQTMNQMLAQQQWPFRVFGSLFAIFAVIAVTLSAVGLYAVMAYSVTQRTQEIGVRLALGAGGNQVLWLILRRGLIQVAIGVTIGLTGAFFMSQALGSRPRADHGPRPRDLCGHLDPARAGRDRRVRHSRAARLAGGPACGVEDGIAETFAGEFYRRSGGQEIHS